MCDLSHVRYFQFELSHPDYRMHMWLKSCVKYFRQFTWKWTILNERRTIFFWKLLSSPLQQTHKTNRSFLFVLRGPQPQDIQLHHIDKLQDISSRRTANIIIEVIFFPRLLKSHLHDEENIVLFNFDSFLIYVAFFFSFFQIHSSIWNLLEVEWCMAIWKM